MKKYSLIIKNYILIFALVFVSSNLVAQQATYVGIPSNSMNYYAAGQNNSQWCWAASIQMVLNGYGVNINQEQIVARTYGIDPYGNLPNWPGSFQAIHKKFKQLGN